MTESPPGAWLLLRGLAREHDHWGGFLARWRAALPGVAVHTPDLPGCGDESSVAAPATMAGVLEAVRGRMPSGRRAFGLVGLSLGGMVAQAWAEAYPDEVAGVVLINTSVAGRSPWWRRVRPGAAARLGLAAATRDVVARERGLVALVSNRPELREETTRAWAEIARLRPVRRATVLRQLLAASRYRTTLQPSVTPTLVLVSQRDRLVHPSCSYNLAAALSAELREHPSAGHDLPMDDPRWVIEQVLDWWHRVATVAAAARV